MPRRRGRRQVARKPKNGRRRGRGANAPPPSYAEATRGSRAVKQQNKAAAVPLVKKNTFLGNLGSKAGAWLGNLAHNGITKFFGMGDYTASPEKGVTSNSLISPVRDIPVMHSDQMGCVRVTHREYIADISTGTLASPYFLQLVLNPGDGRTFPWLNTLAKAFTKYKILGCAFEFVSSSGNAVSSTNSSLGTISMTTQYDVLTPVFNTKKQILNNFWSGSAKPSENQLHFIECEPALTPIQPLFIRNSGNYGKVIDETDGAYISGEVFQESYDPRLYDHGRFELMATGSQQGFIAGELFVTYDILLCQQRMPDLSQIVTYDGPPPLDISPDPQVLHRPEVPLVKVLDINATQYPTIIGLVDQKVDI